MEIDELDRAIISAFHADPRATNRAVAGRVGIAEATVASRIRRLVQTKVLKFTLQRDIRAQGYRFQCIVSIFTLGRAAAKVAADVAKLDAIQTVVLLQSDPEVLASIAARDRSEVVAIEEELGKIDGVDRVSIEVVLDVRKFVQNYAMVQTADS
jgi:DNA-binding Lrp family transcriptional regulator